MFNFPWTNFHELNLDWILSVVKEAKEVFDNGRSDIDYAVDTADEAKEIATQAAEATIADNSISTAKLQNGAVTNAKLASNSVTTANIVDRTIIGNDIAENTIESYNIKNGTIIGADIAENTITSRELSSGAVGYANLADDAVNTAKITDGAITGAKIARGLFKVVDYDYPVSFASGNPLSYVTVMDVETYLSGYQLVSTSLLLVPSAISIFPYVINDIGGKTRLVIYRGSGGAYDETIKIRCLYQSPTINTTN